MEVERNFFWGGVFTDYEKAFEDLRKKHEGGLKGLPRVRKWITIIFECKEIFIRDTGTVKIYDNISVI